MFNSRKEIPCETPKSFSEELRMVLQERNLLTAKSRRKVCAMLTGDSTPNSTPELDKRKTHRRQAIIEILESEKTYLKQLEILLTYFVHPIRELKIIDDKTFATLFGQIEMIYNLNVEFMGSLEKNADNVVHQFLKMAPFFKLYSVYAFDYGKSLLLLQELSAKNAQFHAFLEKNESRPEVQRKLDSLLIIPIQRIPRYKLLLEQVLLYTSPADFEYKALKESIHQIESTVVHINSCIEDQEVTQRLINLQNSLTNRTPTIVQPSRKVIMEGILNKVNRKGEGMKRYCVLMSDIFMYCKLLKDRSPNTTVENSLECSCIFPLKKCKVYEHLPGNFKLTCQGDGLILSSRDIQQLNAWISCIRDAIDSHVECRKTLRKESSKRTPMRKKQVKNFENNLILSPSRKQNNYENIFRNKNSSDIEDLSSDDNKSFLKCFSIKKTQKLKRTPIKCSQLNNSRSALKRIASDMNSIQKSETIAEEENITDIVKIINSGNHNKKSKGIMREPSTIVSTELTEDNLYCFDALSENDDTAHSYFKAVCVDNTIPTTIKRSDLEMSEEFRNDFNIHGGNTLKQSVLQNPLKRRDDESSVILPSKRKRVQFEDNPYTVNQFIQTDVLESEQKLKFSNESTQTPKSSIKDKIFSFLANLF